MAGPVYSTALTNTNAGTKNNPALHDAVKVRNAYVAAGASDSAADGPYHLVRVKSSERIDSITLDGPDFTTAGAIDIGFYRVPEDTINPTAGTPSKVSVTSSKEVASGGTDKTDVLADGFALTDGLPGLTRETMFAGGTNAVTKANSHKRVWEVIGLAADPQKEYLVSVTIATTFNGGPTTDGLLFKVKSTNG